MKPKTQRLVLVIAALAAAIAAVLLAMWGLRDRAAYFYTPSNIHQAAPGRAIRLGGMVEQGSLQRLPDGVTIRFAVTDGKQQTVVVYRGIPPNLFREGSGVVAEGQILPQGLFVADNILAKHDERYMPPQLENEVAEQQAARTLER